MGKSNDDFGFGNFLEVAAAVVAIFGVAVRHAKASARAAAEAKRRAMPIQWTDGLSQEVFEGFCKQAARQIRRLKISSIDGLSISCEVTSSSGLTKWTFSADFYDYGKLSGTYYVGHRQNYDSSIPSVFLQMVSNSIKEITHNYEIQLPQSSDDLIGQKVDGVVALFTNLGFLDVSAISKKRDIFHLFSKKEQVCGVTIEGQAKFTEGQLFKSGGRVLISYFEE